MFRVLQSVARRNALKPTNSLQNGPLSCYGNVRWSSSSLWSSRLLKSSAVVSKASFSSPQFPCSNHSFHRNHPSLSPNSNKPQSLFSSFIPHRSLFQSSWLAAHGFGWQRFPDAKKPPTPNRSRREPSNEIPQSFKESEKIKQIHEILSRLQGQQSGKQKGGGGSAGGKKPEMSEREKMIIAGIGCSALFLGMLALTSGGDASREISWKEFETELLPSGRVAGLVVENKEIVRVYDEHAESGKGDPTRFLSPARTNQHFRIGDVDVFERRLAAAQHRLGLPAERQVSVRYREHTSLWSNILHLAPTLLIIGFWIFLLRTMGGGAMGGIRGGAGGGAGGGGGGASNIFQIGKSPAKLYSPEQSVKVSFKDVAGLPEAKQEVMEFVEFLQNPAHFRKLGARIPRGALLVGPPGTGKTLLARATAGEAKVPFFSTAGSDFIEMFAGVGPARVRDLFAQARKNSPCIVFLDEIDAVGRKRSQGPMRGGNDERENTLNQLLVEMDGFDTGSGVVVLAGTNRPDILDPALLRPGRFDRQISIDKPDIASRREIFSVHLKSLRLSADMPEKSGKSAEEDSTSSNSATTTMAASAVEDEEKTEKEKVLGDQSIKMQQEEGGEGSLTADPVVDAKPKVEPASEDAAEEEVSKERSPLPLVERYAKRLAALSPGFSGADIANVCNEGALIAARESSSYVTLHHLERALDRVIAGIEKKSRVLSPEEKERVAYHESGHAIVGWMLKHTHPLLKVSIVPRGQALGFAQLLPRDQYLYTTAQLRDMMCMTLGGRVAEELIYGGCVSTGASDDLDKVTKIGYALLCEYGMDENNILGPISFPQRGAGEPKPYSELTARAVDAEVRRIIDEELDRARALLTKHDGKLRDLSDQLLEKEVLTREQVKEVLGERPYLVRDHALEFYDQATGGKEGKSEDDHSQDSTPSPAPA